MPIGDFGHAAELLKRNVEEANRGSGTPSYSWRIRSQAWLARTLSALGAFAEGLRHGEEALRLATLTGGGPAPLIAHGCLGLAVPRPRESGARHPGRRPGPGPLSRLWRPGPFCAAIAAGLGSAYALQGRLTEGRALLEEAISESIHAGSPQSYAYAQLSEVCRLAGRGDEAWQHARQALDQARQLKERGNEALALHQLGVVQAHTDPPKVEEAETAYLQALTLAEELGMRPLQAHCHRGLGTPVCRDRPAGAGARCSLGAAVAMYQSMAMTLWLPQTEAVRV